MSDSGRDMNPIDDDIQANWEQVRLERDWTWTQLAEQFERDGSRQLARWAAAHARANAEVDPAAAPKGRGRGRGRQTTATTTTGGDEGGTVTPTGTAAGLLDDGLAQTSAQGAQETPPPPDHAATSPADPAAPHRPAPTGPAESAQPAPSTSGQAGVHAA